MLTNGTLWQSYDYTGIAACGLGWLSLAAWSASVCAPISAPVAAPVAIYAGYASGLGLAGNTVAASFLHDRGVMDQAEFESTLTYNGLGISGSVIGATGALRAGGPAVGEALSVYGNALSNGSNIASTANSLIVPQYEHDNRIMYSF